MAQQNHKQARRSQPASTHPLFPALVTVWFAALLGLGILAVEPSLIDAQILASRLDTLVPFASPPLSMTGRIVLALLFAAIGAIVGARVARLVAPRKRDADEGHTVAAADETDPHALALCGFELAEQEAPPAASDLALEQFDEPVPATEAADIPQVITEPEAEPAGFLEVQPLASTPIRQAAKVPEGSGAQRIASGDLGDLSPVEMLERLALSIQQRERSGLAAPSVTVTYAPQTVPEAAIRPMLRPNDSAMPRDRQIGFDDFDNFRQFGEEAEHFQLRTPSSASPPLAALTPMAQYAVGDVDAEEGEEYEAENDVCEEVYSSLLRASRPADPGLRPATGAYAENAGQSDGESAGSDSEIEPAPGGRLAKLQRLSRDG